MARLAVKIPKREKELEQHTRLVHESDGRVVEIQCSDFQDRFAMAVARRILVDWDKFVLIKEGYAFIEFKEKELCEPMIR